MLRTAVAILCVVVVGCGSKGGGGAGGGSKATYPEPVTEYRGRTADYYGKEALDASQSTWLSSIPPLKALKGEGIPYLLAGLEAQQSNPESTVFLEAIDGKLVHPADLPRVAAFLDGKRKNGFQFEAIVCLCKAGTPAKKYP